LGDNLSAVNLRLSDADTQAYFSDPLANPAAIIELQQAGWCTTHRHTTIPSRPPHLNL
jgi:hypothetical protein